MPTVIRKLTYHEFDRLFRHGFEVADHTLFGYHPDQFNHLAFSASRGGAKIGIVSGSMADVEHSRI
jgi:hypothetical protein